MKKTKSNLYFMMDMLENYCELSPIEEYVISHIGNKTDLDPAFNIVSAIYKRAKEKWPKNKKTSPQSGHKTVKPEKN